MRRRSVLAGSLGLAGLTTLAGCGTPETAGQKSSGKVTISYGVWDENQLPAMRKIVTEFERANPDVRVKIALTPWSSYWTTLQTAMSGRAAPDVFWMNGPLFQLYAGNGALLPITEQLKKDRVDLTAFPAPLVKMYAYGGQQYALPKDFDAIGLWYNKALFDRAGIKYPDESWTCDGFVLRNGKSGYDDERTLTALRFMSDIIRAGHSPNQMAMSDTEPKDLFISGRIATHFNLSPYAIEFHGAPYTKENADVAVLPMKARRSTVTHGIGSVVSAYTRHPEQSRRFVSFLASRRAGQIQGESGSTIPSYRGTQTAWLKSAPEFALKHHLDEMAYADQFPISANTQIWNDLEYRILGPIWAGQGDVVSAARTLAVEMNAALRRERVK
jgi:multiple sugar transport system substrate-binding protein